MSRTRFDDCLPRLVKAVIDGLGEAALESGVVLRDTVGQLTFFSGSSIEPAKCERLVSRLREVLGPYARPDRVVAGPSDLGAQAILEDPSATRITVGAQSVRMVDRRLVGADWLRAPETAEATPARVVFTSIKGGVGRSTALAVCAAHLASRGQRVLVVDLDLEAPGIGPFLLTRDTTPKYGALDALVEWNLGPIDDGFFEDLKGPSPLSSHGGRVDVVPAYGLRSLEYPAEVLAKIARAYAEHVGVGGQVETILDKTRGVLARLAPAGAYDAVLIDARAGLHETTATAVLGLGAEVLLFAVNEPQTFDGYAPLLAHLARFVTSDDSPWLERLRVVQAKAPVDADARQGFTDRWRALVEAQLPSLSGPSPSSVPLPDGFRDVPWDDNAPDDDVLLLPRELPLREPLAVLFDQRFHGFDPLRRRDQVSDAVYGPTFGRLVDHIERITRPVEEPT